MSTATVRVFVAVHLPAPQRAALEGAIALLQERGLTRVRWVRPEGIHLTLKFLGDIPASQVDAVTDAMYGIAVGPKPFRLELSSLGAFPNLNKARVLWCGIGGEMEQLSALQERTERALEPLGYRRENRPFAPHLTLGRVRESARPPDPAMLQQALDACVPGPLDQWLVDEVCLMRTTPLPGGSQYDVVATAKLTG